MTFTSVNPHDPADVLGEWEAASAGEADAALGRALNAAQAWRDTPGAARAKALGDAAAALEQRAAEVTAWRSARSASRSLRRAARSAGEWRSCGTAVTRAQVG